MKINTDKPANLGRLHQELNAALGRPVALVRNDTVITVIDRATGQPLADGAVDMKLVNRVIADHVFVNPDELPTAEEKLAEALESATTVEDLRAALVARYVPAAEEARKARMSRLEAKAARRARVGRV